MKNLILPVSRVLVLVGILLMGMSLTNPMPDTIRLSRAYDGTLSTGWENNLVVVTRPAVTMEDFSKMKVRDFEKLTGQELNFAQKLGFRGMRKYVKRAIKNDDMDGSAPAPALDDVQKGFWIGFGLGLLFGVLGFVGAIVWRLVDNKNPMTEKIIGGGAAGCLVAVVFIVALMAIAGYWAI